MKLGVVSLWWHSGADFRLKIQPVVECIALASSVHADHNNLTPASYLIPRIVNTWSSNVGLHFVHSCCLIINIVSRVVNEI